jgi:multiple sugar transport system substrate-binding protein
MHAGAEARPDGGEINVTAIKTVAAGLAAMLLVSAAVPAFADPVTVNFLTAERPETFASVIAQFEKENPDIKVNFETVPFDSMVPTIEARLGGHDSSIDVFLVDTPRVPAMAHSGYLLKINDEMDKVKAVANEEAQGVLTYKGDLYALPFWTSTQLMYYNRDLFDKAGVSYPSAEEKDRMTYAETIDLAKKVMAGSGAKYGFVPEQIDRYYQLQPIFQGNGGGTGLTGPDNLTPDVTNDKWIAAGKFYASLFADGIAPRGITDDQMSSTFTSGDTVFYIGGPWQFTTFNATDGLHYGVAPVPYWKDGKPQTPTDSWGVAISPYAAHPEEAKKFAEYITLDPEGAGLIVKANPIIPVNKEAYGPYIDWIASLDPKVGPDAKKIMTYELADTAVSRPRSIGYVAFETVMNKAFSDIRNGSDVEGTLKQAQQQLTSQLRRIQ